jgi:hypothetical protein
MASGIEEFAKRPVYGQKCATRMASQPPADFGHKIAVSDYLQGAKMAQQRAKEGLIVA